MHYLTPFRSVIYIMGRHFQTVSHSCNHKLKYLRTILPRCLVRCKLSQYCYSACNTLRNIFVINITRTMDTKRERPYDGWLAVQWLVDRTMVGWPNNAGWLTIQWSVDRTTLVGCRTMVGWPYDDWSAVRRLVDCIWVIHFTRVPHTSAEPRSAIYGELRLAK